MIGERLKRTAIWEYRKARNYLRSSDTISVGNTSIQIKTDTIHEYLRADDLKGEEEFVSQILLEVDSAEVVWDIGANIGTHSLLLAQNVEKVISFEPHPPTASRLMENVEYNNENIDVVAVALGNSEGTVPLRLPEDSADEVGVGRFTTTGEGDVDVIVAEKRAETLLSTKSLSSPDVVKIDVEGAELDVLEGFGKYLPTVDTIFCELHPQFIDGSDVISLLEQNGFTINLHGERGEETHLIAKQE